MEEKDKYADFREANDDEIKGLFWREFVEEHGEAYAEANKGGWEASWQYILTLGFNGRFFVLTDGRIISEADLDGRLTRRVARKMFEIKSR